MHFQDLDEYLFELLKANNKKTFNVTKIEKKSKLVTLNGLFSYLFICTNRYSGIFYLMLKLCKINYF